MTEKGGEAPAGETCTPFSSRSSSWDATEGGREYLWLISMWVVLVLSQSESGSRHESECMYTP